VNKFHKVVAAVEAIALRLTVLALLLATLWEFVRHAMHW
jgi:hypothetical protein